MKLGDNDFLVLHRPQQGHTESRVQDVLTTTLILRPTGASAAVDKTCRRDKTVNILIKLSVGKKINHAAASCQL